MVDPTLILRRLVRAKFPGDCGARSRVSPKMQILCLVGTNGAGKSSLISLLAHALCQFTRESIPDFGTDLHVGSKSRGSTSFTADEVGPLGESCCVCSDWAVEGTEFSHLAFARRESISLDRFTKRLAEAFGVSEEDRSFVGWRQGLLPENDPVARNVLLFRPSCRCDPLRANRPGPGSLMPAAAPARREPTRKLSPDQPIETGSDIGRRWLPVRPKSGLQDLEHLAASIANDDDVLAQRWFQRIHDSQGVLRGVWEKFRLEESPEFRLGIGNLPTVALLSAGEIDALVTVGHIAAQQLYLKKKFRGSHRDPDPSGWVFIDEIDLHLHPDWQERILPLLTEMFPTVHFVVTTHSPFVLRSLPRERALVLRLPDGEVFTEDFSAMSIENILNIVFRVPSRWNREIQHELEILESAAGDPAQHETVLEIYRRLAPRSVGLLAACDRILSIYDARQAIDEIAGLEQNPQRDTAGARRPR